MTNVGCGVIVNKAVFTIDLSGMRMILYFSDINSVALLTHIGG